MVIENIKSIIGYSSNSLKDFSKLLDSLKSYQNYDHVLDLVYDAYDFGKKLIMGSKKTANYTSTIVLQ